MKTHSSTVIARLGNEGIIETTVLRRAVAQGRASNEATLRLGQLAEFISLREIAERIRQIGTVPRTGLKWYLSELRGEGTDVGTLLTELENSEQFVQTISRYCS